ncbi:MAG: class I tRNA ligase family protein, partial [Blastocatellia bacterium]
FLGRVWRMVYKWHDKLSGAAEGEFSSEARALRRKTHQTIRRVTHDIGERMNFNTAVAAMMELTNEIYAFDGSLKGEAADADRFAMKEAMEALAKLLAPFTPPIAEELWQSLGHDEIVVASAWPQFDAELAKEEELEIPVQLNGKLIARVMVAADVSDEAMKEAALASDRVQAKLEGKQIVKTIIVSKRLVNVVAK